MSLAAWVMVGWIAGLIAYKIVNGTEQGVLTDILLALVGVVLGSSLAHIYAMAEMGELPSYSLLIAGFSVSLLLVHLAMTGGHRETTGIRPSCSSSGEST